MALSEVESFFRFIVLRYGINEAVKFKLSLFRCFFFIIVIAPARDRFHRRLASHCSASMSTSRTHRGKRDYLLRSCPVAVDKVQLK